MSINKKKEMPEIEENKNITADTGSSRMHGMYRMRCKKASIRTGRACEK